jgi:hypothetical protein
MIPDYSWRLGDEEPIFAQQLVSDVTGEAVDLSGATVNLLMRSLSSATLQPLDSAVAIVTPPGGSYPSQVQWAPDATDNANIAAGVYLGNWQVLFADGTEQTFPTSGYLWIEAQESLSALQLDVGSRPSNRQVAGLLRARTKIRGGTELGYFNDVGAPNGTRPMASEVDGLIDEAMDEVLGKIVGVDSTQPPGSAYNAPGSPYERRIRGAVALYTAILVELSYFPEQAGTQQSTVAAFQGLYASRIKSLISEDKTGQPEGMGDSGGSGSSAGGDSPADAAWAFPADTGGLVGWCSQWLVDPSDYAWDAWEIRRWR